MVPVILTFRTQRENLITPPASITHGVVNTSPDEQSVRLSKLELQEIKDIYRSVMNLAANGLFFRAGQVIGRGIAKRAEARGGTFLAEASDIIIEEGWARSAELDREEAKIEGCIEASRGEERSCNILRGILAEVYAHHYETKLFCHEVECSGSGAPMCTFQIRKGVL
jgi:predicted hydrocarbon binding protein